MPNRASLPMLASLCLLAAPARAAEVPRPSPDFAITLTAGKTIQLNEYKGKVRALAFILTTCPHCQKTVGILSAMQNEFGPRGFQVLASAIDDMAAMLVPDFIQRFKPPFPVGYSVREPVLAYLQHPAIFRLLMPQVVFIDRGGTIRAQYAGDDKFFAGDQEKNIREQIESLLKEPAAATRKRADAAPKKQS